MELSDMASDFFCDYTKTFEDCCIVSIFRIFIEEECIPDLIKCCKSFCVDRYDLIDHLKELMVTEIEENESLFEDDNVTELLTTDLELVTLQRLDFHLTIQNKRTILFKLSDVYYDMIHYLIVSGFQCISSIFDSLSKQCSKTLFIKTLDKLERGKENDY